MKRNEIIELTLVKNLNPIATKECKYENGYSVLNVYNFKGYEIEVEEVVEDGNGKEHYISIYKDWNEEYLPEIRYNNRKKDFTIQTTSYGSLKPEEIKKVIEGYETAMYVVAVMKSELF